MTVEIVAELSGSHGGSLDNALALVDVAFAVGATMVKTQCFDPEMMTIDHDGPGFIIRGGLWDGRKLIDLYRETATPWEWQEAISTRAKMHGMKFMSSVFCKGSTDYIASLSPDAIKISTFEFVDTPLIEHAASKGFPMVLSCGMASNYEAELVVDALAKAKDVTFLACPAGYPAPITGGQFDLPQPITDILSDKTRWGLSDHSRSKLLAAAAVAKGATMIERHLKLPGVKTPDDAFSFAPDEFAQMVASVREIEPAVGPREARSEPQRDIRRSLYAVEDIKKGDVITERNVRSIRPGHGLPPRDLPRLLGCLAKHDIARGTPLKKGDVA